MRDIICPYLIRTPDGKFYCRAKKLLRMKDTEIDPAWNPCVAYWWECKYYKKVQKKRRRKK